MRFLILTLFVFVCASTAESADEGIPSEKSEKVRGGAEEKSDDLEDAIYEEYEYEDGNSISGRNPGNSSEGFPEEVFLTLRNITADAATAFRSFTNRNDVVDLQASASDNLNVTVNNTFGDAESAGINLRALRDAGHPPQVVEENLEPVQLPYKHAKIDTADLSDCALQGEWKPMGVAHGHLHVAADHAQQADVLQSVGSYAVPNKVIPHWQQDLGGAGLDLQDGGGSPKPAGLYSASAAGHSQASGFEAVSGAGHREPNHNYGGFSGLGQFQKLKSGSMLAPPPVPPIIFGKKPGYWKLPKTKHKFFPAKGRRPAVAGYGFGGGSGGYSGHSGHSGHSGGVLVSGGAIRGGSGVAGSHGYGLSGGYRGGHGLSVSSGTGHGLGGGSAGYGGAVSVSGGSGHSYGGAGGGLSVSGGSGHGFGGSSGGLSVSGGSGHGFGGSSGGLSVSGGSGHGFGGGSGGLSGSGGLGHSYGGTGGAVSISGASGHGFGAAGTGSTGSGHAHGDAHVLSGSSTSLGHLSHGVGATGGLPLSGGGSDLSGTFASDGGDTLLVHGSGPGQAGGHLLLNTAAGRPEAAFLTDLHKPVVGVGGGGGHYVDSTFSSSQIGGSSVPDAAYVSTHINQDFAVQGVSDDMSSTFTCGKNHDHNTNYHTATFQVADHDHPSSVDVLQYGGDAAVLIQSGDASFHDHVLPERKHYKAADTEVSGSDNRNELTSQAAQLTAKPVEQDAGQTEQEPAKAEDGDEPERHSYYHEITKVTKIPASSVGSVEYTFSKYETKPQTFSTEIDNGQEEPEVEQPQIIRELEHLSNKFQLDVENPQKLFEDPPSQELAFHYPFQEGEHHEAEKLEGGKEGTHEGITEFPYQFYNPPQIYKKPVKYVPRPGKPYFQQKTTVSYLQPKPVVLLRKHKPLKKKQNYEVQEHGGERHRPIGEIFPPQKFPKQFHNPKPNFAVDRPKPGWRPDAYTEFHSHGKKVKKFKTKAKVVAPVLVRRPVSPAPVIRVVEVTG